MRILIGIGAVFSFLFLLGCTMHETPAESVAFHPEHTYDVRVEVIAGDTISQVRCYDEYMDEIIGEFNHSFFELRDQEIHFEEGYENNIAVQNRINFWNLWENFDEFEENPAFINMTDNLEDYHDYIECRAKILTPENDWKIEIYDNGYKEEHQLNLFDPIDIKCHTIFDDFGEIYKWDCTYSYHFGDWKDDFDWMIVESIERAMLTKIVDRWLE